MADSSPRIAGAESPIMLGPNIQRSLLSYRPQLGFSPGNLGGFVLTRHKESPVSPPRLVSRPGRWRSAGENSVRSTHPALPHVGESLKNPMWKVRTRTPGPSMAMVRGINEGIFCKMGGGRFSKSMPNYHFRVVRMRHLVGHFVPYSILHS